jgi:pantoate--beta-alanine ligase
MLNQAISRPLNTSLPSMKVCTTIEEIQSLVSAWKAQGLSVGFVPTMGNLHAGHLSLLAEAKSQADRVVMSIFVNPLQFGAGEDFDQYPRTLEQDKAAIEKVGIDALFLPTSDTLYPRGLDNQTSVIVPEALTVLWEGAKRPGHFDGVSTVVYKLFAAVTPDLAVFGQKDYQQLKVIEWMVADLMLPVKIVSAPIVRDENGLALSSRNQYLSKEQRVIASKLNVVLQNVYLALISGNKNFSALESQATQLLLREGFDAVDYVSICDSTTLQNAKLSDSNLVILATARLGSTRLLDNLEVSVESS